MVDVALGIALFVVIMLATIGIAMLCERRRPANQSIKDELEKARTAARLWELKAQEWEGRYKRLTQAIDAARMGDAPVNGNPQRAMTAATTLPNNITRW